MWKPLIFKTLPLVLLSGSTKFSEVDPHQLVSQLAANNGSSNKSETGPGKAVKTRSLQPTNKNTFLFVCLLLRSGLILPKLALDFGWPCHNLRSAGITGLYHQHSVYVMLRIKARVTRMPGKNFTHWDKRPKKS